MQKLFYHQEHTDEDWQPGVNKKEDVHVLFFALGILSSDNMVMFKIAGPNFRAGRYHPLNVELCIHINRATDYI